MHNVNIQWIYVANDILWSIEMSTLKALHVNSMKKTWRENTHTCNAHRFGVRVKVCNQPVEVNFLFLFGKLTQINCEDGKKYDVALLNFPRFYHKSIVWLKSCACQNLNHSFIKCKWQFAISVLMFNDGWIEAALTIVFSCIKYRNYLFAIRTPLICIENFTVLTFAHNTQPNVCVFFFCNFSNMSLI